MSRTLRRVRVGRRNAPPHGGPGFAAPPGQAVDPRRVPAQEHAAQRGRDRRREHLHVRILSAWGKYRSLIRVARPKNGEARHGFIILSLVVASK